MRCEQKREAEREEGRERESARERAQRRQYLNYIKKAVGFIRVHYSFYFPLTATMYALLFTKLRICMWDCATENGGGCYYGIVVLLFRRNQPSGRIGNQLKVPFHSAPERGLVVSH